MPRLDQRADPSSSASRFSDRRLLRQPFRKAHPSIAQRAAPRRRRRIRSVGGAAMDPGHTFVTESSRRLGGTDRTLAAAIRASSAATDSRKRRLLQPCSRRPTPPSARCPTAPVDGADEPAQLGAELERGRQRPGSCRAQDQRPDRSRYQGGRRSGALSQPRRADLVRATMSGDADPADRRQAAARRASARATSAQANRNVMHVIDAVLVSPTA